MVTGNQKHSSRTDRSACTADVCIHYFFFSSLKEKEPPFESDVIEKNQFPTINRKGYKSITLCQRCVNSLFLKSEALKISSL